MKSTSRQAQRNRSEELFERYLTASGHRDWEFEPEVPGKSKHPDYSVRYRGQRLFFEVKELRAKGPVPEAPTHMDGYRSLRMEIDEARRKFREFKDFCCVLVVYDLDDWQARLETDDVSSAMMGDEGMRFPVTPSGKVLLEGGRPAFLGRGKMRTKSGHRQNTTISAIIVLRDDPIPDRPFCAAFTAARERKETELGRGLHPCEAAEIRRQLYADMPEGIRRIARAQVFENPYARHAFPDTLCLGSYDERYAIVDGQVRQRFRGDGLTTQENTS